ncbi:hypothetical protein [Hymenobacter defluvii]|uniref:Uncharacterized protein n=1 Tax=Hymenobacter defluvii TaxID=2054411 RepID=A0ABS3TI81_9BACT|nr:hypothetical protein [Hymenobacter defluvii]MBO3273366.1 hypothetical protein [Hymenobacter defluvii]
MCYYARSFQLGILQPPYLIQYPADTLDGLPLEEVADLQLDPLLGQRFPAPHVGTGLLQGLFDLGRLRRVSGLDHGMQRRWVLRQLLAALLLFTLLPRCFLLLRALYRLLQLRP